METKKYLSLERLTEYDGLIKEKIDQGDASTLSSAKSYTDTKVSNITNGTTVVKSAEHATSADSATSATSATKATQDGNGKVISSTYETKADATSKLSEAKTYTDTKTSGLASTSSVNSAISTHNSATDAHSDIRTTLAEVKEDVDAFFKDATISTAAKDTLKEIQDYITSDAEAAAAMTASINGKANKATTLSGYGITDAYTKTQVDSALSGKANSSHGTHVTFDSTNKPKMDGTAAFGTSTSVARADHVHPTDTSRASKSEFDSHDTNTTKHITSTERTDWNAAKTHADSAHAPSNAQANVIETIKVNGTAQTVTSKSVNITVPTDNASLTNGAGYLVSSDIANKANKATTLSGYGITNAYTKTEVDAKTVVDNALSTSSTNPVQNKVVNSAISTLTSSVSSNTSSISAHTTAISNLQTALGAITDITSEEIQALFNA